MPSQKRDWFAGLRTRLCLLAGVLGLMLSATVATAQDGEEEAAPERQPFYGREIGDPWKLVKSPNYDWGGWIQMGWQDLPDGAFTGNGPFLNQHEWGKFNLNQLYVYTQRVADGSQGFDWGYRVDSMYGVDGNEGQSFGNINGGHWDYLNGFDHGIYEIALPQAYGEAALGNLSVKVGHFYTIIGYEVVTSPDNFFLSRQITFWNSEPFTHTGALANYKVNDNFSFSGGWVAGMDTGFYVFGGGSSFLGGFNWQMNDYVSLVYAMIGGNLGWRGNGAINSAIMSVKWTDRLTSVHQFDVLGTNLTVDAAGVPLAGNIPSNFRISGIARNSTGFINYAFYRLTDRLAAGGRIEWYKADGTSYYEATGGINVKPHANVTIRPEIRRNWSPGNPVSPWKGTILGCDVIFLF